jgi:hypothetical protein
MAQKFTMDRNLQSKALRPIAQTSRRAMQARSLTSQQTNLMMLSGQPLARAKNWLLAITANLSVAVSSS